MATIQGRRRWANMLATAAAVAAGAFVCGAAAVHFDTPPYRWAKQARNLVAPETQAAAEGRRFYDSIFVRLEGESVKLPIAYHGGGALGVLGEEWLVVTAEGVFVATGPADVARADIVLPDNGAAAYREAAAGKYAGYQHKFNWLRYNDVLVLPEPAGPRILVSYTKYFGAEECYRTVISDVSLPPGATLATASIGADDWRTFYRTEPCLPLKPTYYALEGITAGGRMTHDGAGRLYLGNGDYHWDGVYADKAVAQLDDHDYGKVIEIDLASGAARSLTRGHRNLQGIAFDRAGDLYAVEHGMRGGDELNRIVEGRDYGYPQETLGTLYNKLPFPGTISLGRHETFEPPVYAWLPSVAISSLKRIDGFHEAWDGDLLMGTLKDESLFRIRVTPAGVRFTERIEIGQRVRYALQQDDRLLVYTDAARLIFLQVAEQSYAQAFLAGWLDGLEADDDLRRHIGTALVACQQCHSLDAGDDQTAPTLAGVFGRPIAGSGFDGYSDALRAQQGRWDTDRLARFIADPASVAEGSTMPPPGIDDPRVLAGVVDFLEALSRTTD